MIVLLPYRGMVQGAVLRNRSELSTRTFFTVTAGNLLLVSLAVALALGLGSLEVFPSPWFAVVFVVVFIGGGIAGWQKGSGEEDPSQVAA